MNTHRGLQKQKNLSLSSVRFNYCTASPHLSELPVAVVSHEFCTLCVLVSENEEIAPTSVKS